MKFLKAFFIAFALCLQAFALEFGSMGNTSAAMGGAGVALKHSAWGLYYNPALLSSNPKTKIGYSLGIGLKERNLAKLTNIDVKNMQNTAERLIETFANASSGTTSQSEITNIFEKALDSVHTSSGTSTTLQDKLNQYLNNHPDGNYSDLINAVVKETNQSTILTQTQKDILDNIAKNIEYENLSFSSTAQNMLTSITIDKGGDNGLDKAVDDIATVQRILRNNNLNVVSQNGVILQLSSQTINETLGTFGVAYFGSVYSSMSAKADESRMRLIVKGGSGYYELINNGNSYTFSSSSENDYNTSSIIASLQGDSDAHKLIATSFILSEIPIGYARTFYLKHGNINIGVAGKLMNGRSVQNQMNLNTNLDIKKELKSFASLDNAISSNDFGVDVGVLYELDLPKFRYLTVGLVGKNLNSPTFKSTLTDIIIKPQYRLGLGFNSPYWNLAFDVDLTPNDILSFSNKKQQSQMLGGGVAFDAGFMDIRLGAMKDLHQDTGLILTGGINLFGFLDIALQSSTKMMKVDNYKVPTYLNLRIGGSFSF